MRSFYRLRLLAMMALLLAVMAAVVCWASPYAPVVSPAPEDIQTLWDIEDARSESETPLVTALENHGVPLAYDAENNTFYCTLGLENESEWPQLHLTAPGAKGVKLIFADDYSYDWCADAVRRCCEVDERIKSVSGVDGADELKLLLMELAQGVQK